MQNCKKKIIRENKKQQFAKLNFCQKENRVRAFLNILITVTLATFLLWWKEMLSCKLMVLKVSQKLRNMQTNLGSKGIVIMKKLITSRYVLENFDGEGDN